MHASPNHSSTYGEALRLFDKGFSVIPLHPRDKRPAVSWKAYQSRQPTYDEIKHWFGNGLERNVGIVTGAVSGVVVLDVDSEDALAALGDLPRTPTVKTGKGCHYYFKHPGTDVGNKVRLIHGVDVRADRGYAVAPPSVHPNGAAYEWIVGLDEPLADLPDWVLAPANDNGQTSNYGRAWFKEAEALADTEAGQRNDLLNKVACKAGSLIASGHLNESEARAAMLDACKRNGLLYDTGGQAGVLATINSGLKEGKCNPRCPLDPLTTEVVYTGGKLTIRKASEIKLEKISWLWDGVLPRGALLILAGNPGLGKSQVSLSIAAAVSSGDYWPVSRQRASQGNVIILSMEDRAEDTIVPRLVAAGADLDRVLILTTVTDSNEAERQFNLKQDLPRLRNAIDEIGDVALIVIDPITAYLGSADANDSGAIRGITTELSGLAQSYGVCILAVSHLNKKADQQAAHRILGSISFVAAARTVFMIERDAEDADRRIMAPAKNNLAPDTTAFAFTVEPVSLLGSGIQTSKITWAAYSQSKTADQVLHEKDESPGARGEAKDFLRSILEAGPAPARRILDTAKESGIAEKTLRRAKEDLLCRSVQRDAVWCWSLPDGQ